MAKNNSLTVNTEAPVTKRRAPRTAFGPDNPHKFVPGDPRINRTGRAKAVEKRLISKALHRHLGARADDALCAKFRLPPRSSYAQVIGMALVFQAIRGDINAVREIRAAVGDGNVNPFGLEGQSEVLVQFVAAPGAVGHDPADAGDLLEGSSV